ncbi:MAG: bacteriohemerythrin [Gammaproteobacteria bacterium]|jgi:hemerythrin|nr:bacteriohemerythrin [Gammaproteobacteria bacterium]
MTLIAWRNEFSVGVDAVDHEHREMIALINELDEAMQDDASQATVVEALGEIYARISAHFALEEKTMRDARYSQLAEHKQDHEQLLDELLDVIDSVDDEGRYDRADLSRSLDRWFSDHFRTHDARLHHELG